MRARCVSLSILLLVVAGCVEGDVTDSTTTSAGVTSTVVGPATTTTEVVATSTSEAAGPADWGEATPAAGTYQTTVFVPSLTFTINDGWVPILPELPETVDLIDMKRSEDAGLSFLNISGRSPEENLEFLRSSDSIELGEEVPTEVGGVTGTMVEATADPQTKIADLSEGVQWGLFVGYRYRIQILEVGGQTVTIIIEGTDETYEPFVTEADLVLDSVVWGD